MGSTPSLNAASHAATMSPSRSQKAMSRKARICSSVIPLMNPMVAEAAR